MLERCKNAQERWGGVHKLIDQWLQARQTLIVQLCDLSTSHPLSSQYCLGKDIQRFGQTLMDYCSTGHFEMYEQLELEAQSFNDDSAGLCSLLMPKLEQITQRCVDFNDKYHEQCTLDALGTLANDLSKLAEILEERFSLEDQLIATLHTAHQHLAVQA